MVQRFLTFFHRASTVFCFQLAKQISTATMVFPDGHPVPGLRFGGCDLCDNALVKGDTYLPWSRMTTRRPTDASKVPLDPRITHRTAFAQLSTSLKWALFVLLDEPAASARTAPRPFLYMPIASVCSCVWSRENPERRPGFSLHQAGLEVAMARCTLPVPG